MNETQLPETASMLQSLQPEKPVNVKKIAAEQLGQVEESNLEIVQALIAAKELDPSYQVRVQAEESLGADVHQEILGQHPELMALAESEALPSVGHPLVENERQVVRGDMEVVESRRYRAHILGVMRRVVGWVLLVCVGVALVVAIVCWLIGWRSLPEYARGLRYGALAVFVLGGSQVYMFWNEPVSIPKTREEWDKDFLVLYVALSAAILLFGLGVLIGRIAGS